MNIKLTYRITLFTVNAISMMLELIAARILSPYLGSSNVVWTIIISMMLLSNAIGNCYGGKIIDKFPAEKVYPWILFVSAAATSVIAILNALVVSKIKLHVTESQGLAATSVLALFMIPCILLGMTSPVSNKQEIEERSGTGVIFVIITAGSLIGTLIGGFVLVPLAGSNKALIILAGVLYVLAVWHLSLNTYTFRQNRVMLAAVAVFAAAATVVPLTISGPASDGEVQVFDTTEGYVRIYDDEYNGEKIRVMNISGGWSSANYTDPQKRDELVNEYTRTYDEIFKAGDFKSLCMIGGAGYTYPRHLISHYDDKTIDVVEIDEMVTRIAMDHFYLGEFLDEYGYDRISLITDDGRLYLDRTEKMYDAILNDAFSGDVPARSLATKEAAQSIKAHLTPGGVYATNIIGDLNKKGNTFLRSEVITLSDVFKHVWILDTNPERAGRKNYIVIASDAGYSYDSIPFSPTGEEIVFTDDYSPTDMLAH